MENQAEITPEKCPELFEKVGVLSEQIETAGVERIGFWSIVWEQFRKNKFAMGGLYCFALLVIIAVYAPVITLDKPFFCYFKATESTEEFDRIDLLGKDGFVDKHEVATPFWCGVGLGSLYDVQHFPKMDLPRFKKLDANRDNRVSEWEWKGGFAFPWFVSLFDRRFFQNGVDIFFNLIMVLSPLYLLAWYLLRKRLKKAMSLYFLRILACFMVFHFSVFVWVMLGEEGQTGLPLLFQVLMEAVPLFFLVSVIALMRRRAEEHKSIVVCSIAACLLVAHLILFSLGMLPNGNWYYNALSKGGYYGKSPTDYDEFKRKVSRQVNVLKKHSAPVKSLAWSPDGLMLASAACPKSEIKAGETEMKIALNIQILKKTLDTDIYIWDTEGGRQLATFAGHQEGVTSLSWSPNGRFLASASSDKTIRLWDVQNAREATTLYGHTDAVTSVAWSPEGSFLISGSKDRTVRLWDVRHPLPFNETALKLIGSLAYESHPNPKPITALLGHEDAVTSVAWSPTGRMFASASSDKTVRLRDLATQKEVAVLKCPDVVSSVSWSPDGRLLASSSGTAIYLWDAMNAMQKACLSGHKGDVHWVSWSPDGKLLASASSDETIRIWDVAECKESDLLPAKANFGHTRSITCALWNPDGKTLASASEDRSIILWDIAGERPRVFYLYPLFCYNFSDTDTTEINPRPPSRRFYLGTNSEGKDVVALMIFGTRISLTIGIVAVSIYIAIGILIGSMAGFFGGRVDLLISRFIEVMLCFPTLFFILAIVAIFEETSIFHIMVVIGVTSWTTTARLVRAEFLRLRNIEYVQAAIALGLRKTRVIFSHILPNALGPVLVAATFGVAASILIESTLAFLGLGDPSAPSWGVVLRQGYNTDKMWLILAPGFAIFFVVSVLNLVGEGLRDALDPKLRQ